MMTVFSQDYQRQLSPGFTPFDPLELAKRTEQIVCHGDHRKYTKFYCTGVYGGIATGYTCGCCLRCIFCWVDWSRDFPEKYGLFHSPVEAFRKLSRVARKARVNKLRISGAEPTLGKSHLLGLLEKVESSPFRLFILETNGILIGADPDYARQIARFKKVHTRISLKAGTPEAFTRKTGAKPESFELPFRAIVNLMEAGASFHVAAMSADTRIVTQLERQGLLERLASIDPALVRNLEEEVVEPYHCTLERLQHAGVELTWRENRDG
ncbi:MAG: radical SAM protein [Sedimentisphaerales bacterium]